MSKAKMQAARELIQEKRYQEARAILQSVDHPTARKWLAKLDQIAPVQSQSSWSQLERTPPPIDWADGPRDTGPEANGNKQVVGFALGAVSLFTGVVGFIILAGLLIFVVQGTQQGYGSEYGSMLPWAIAVFILLPVAYITNKVSRRMRA